MAIKPTKRLLSEQDDDRPNVISQKLLAGPVEDEDCPWVEIGNLYLSVTIIGEHSWLPLISLLRKRKPRYMQYVVFTGRHGDVPNRVSNRTGHTVGVFDQGHVNEDKNVRVLALREFPELGIELVDAATGSRLQTEWLRTATKRKIDDDKIVIYAWCYGLFSMCEADSDAPQRVLESHNLVLIGKTVRQLVKEYWNWVPRG